MSNTLSFSELEAQHAELLPARTLMQTGGLLGGPIVANADIDNAFPGGANAAASWLFITTWDTVGF